MTRLARAARDGDARSRWQCGSKAEPEVPQRIGHPLHSAHWPCLLYMAGPLPE